MHKKAQRTLEKHPLFLKLKERMKVYNIHLHSNIGAPAVYLESLTCFCIDACKCCRFLGCPGLWSVIDRCGCIIRGVQVFETWMSISRDIMKKENTIVVSVVSVSSNGKVSTLWCTSDDVVLYLYTTLLSLVRCSYWFFTEPCSLPMLHSWDVQVIRVCRSPVGCPRHLHTDCKKHKRITWTALKSPLQVV